LEDADMTSKRTDAILVTALLITVLACSWAMAEEDTVTSATSTTTFTGEINVPVINVDVLVTDRRGQPVAGLSADDFEVLEDDQPMAISHFYSPPDMVPAGLSSPVVPAPGAVQQPVEVRPLSLIVLVNTQGFNPRAQHLAMSELRSFLNSGLPARCRVLLATISGSVEVRLPFTNDRQRLLQVVEELSTGAPSTRRLETSQLMYRIDTVAQELAAGGGGGESAFDPTIEIKELRDACRDYAKGVRDRVRFEIRAVDSFIRSFAGLPGAKAILYVGSEIEMYPGLDMLQAFERHFPDWLDAPIEARRYDAAREIRKLVEKANSHSVSFYTLSSLAVNALDGTAADARGFGDGSAFVTVQNLSFEEAALMMAERTGGRTLETTAALDQAMVEVVTDMSSAYSLAYQPTHAGDGKYHMIRIKCLRKGVNLQYRRGYLDLGDAARVSDRTVTAAVHGVTDDPVGLSFSVIDDISEEAATDDDTSVAIVLVRLPLSQVGLIPGNQGYEGKLSLFFAVSSENGARLSPVHRQEYQVHIEEHRMSEVATKEGLFSARLRLGQGRQRIAVGFLDETTRVEATRVFEVEPAAEASSAARL
jgi:VWFA-related protein